MTEPQAGHEHRPSDRDPVPIRFGTSGWRGIIAREFTWDRVDLILDAIAAHLVREGRRSIVVGGDCRFLSPELAVAAAGRLSGMGFRVLLADRPTPTPVLSHACRSLDAGGVVNFTASHNPPLYNGIKFSPWHGGPADGDVTSDLERLVEARAKAPGAQGSVEVTDFVSGYVRTLLDLLDPERFRESGLRVVYDAFSGTGSGILDRILVDLGVSVRVLNGLRDPLFAGREHPEPGEEGTADLSASVLRSGASLGVATDGDADRFGLVDENGSFVSPHDFLPLLVDYLAGEKGMRGLVVRSVTTGSLLDRVAAAHGLELEVTPVGFKYLGAKMLSTEVLLAGEESGGLSILGHVPEKDGILACLLAAEMVCARGKGLAAQLADLWKAHGRSHLSRRDIPLDEHLRKLLVGRFFDSVPTGVGGLRVERIDRTDGVRLLLEDGSWVLLRLSGTEPLARIYAEAATPELRDRLLDALLPRTDGED